MPPRVTNPPSRAMLVGTPPARTNIGKPTQIRTKGAPINIVNRRGGSGIRGPMGLANFAARAPQRSTIGFVSNYNVPYARIMRPYSRKFMNMGQKYMLIITKKDRTIGSNMQGNVRKDALPRTTMANIVMWNYMQANREIKPVRPEDVKTPQQVWEDWYVEGPCKSEEGEEPDNDGNFQASERLLNNVVRGSYQTFNIWGPGVQPGTYLWLILKKVEIKKDRPYYVSEKNGEGRMPSAVVDGTNTHMPYQLIPYADYRYPRPPISDLLFTDEFGNERYGLPIYVGRAEDVPSKPSINFTRLTDVASNVRAILMQPMLDVMVDTFSVRLTCG